MFFGIRLLTRADFPGARVFFGSIIVVLVSRGTTFEGVDELEMFATRGVNLITLCEDSEYFL